MSRGELFLTKDDLRQVTNAIGKRLLLTNVPGYSIILFYASSCPLCQKFLQVFRILSNHSNLAQVGKACIRPQDIEFYRGFIERVPFIVFYVNGIPTEVYIGPDDVQELMNFVKRAVDKIQNQKQPFLQQRPTNQPQPQQPQQPQQQIRMEGYQQMNPQQHQQFVQNGQYQAQMWGIPYCDVKGGCYAEFNDGRGGYASNTHKTEQYYKYSEDNTAQQLRNGGIPQYMR